jgi:hypothetical protein
MEPIIIKAVFVRTKNARNFEVMLDGLALARGEGRLGCVPSPPGRGKTYTAQIYAANHDCIYFRVASIWKHSGLDFMQALCLEVGITSPPGRKGRCYSEVVERLRGTERPVFIDEVQRLPKDFLNVILDLSDATACPFVLLGEEELKGLMQENKRVWSRTYQLLEFDPISEADVIFYVREAMGLRLSHEVAAILHANSGGDFRIVRRDLLAVVQFANAKQTIEIDEELARIATGVALGGPGANGRRAARRS